MKKSIKITDIRKMDLTELEFALIEYDIDDINKAYAKGEYCSATVFFFEHSSWNGSCGEVVMNAYRKAVKYFIGEFLMIHGGMASFKECCGYIADIFRVYSYSIPRFLKGLVIGTDIVIEDNFGLDNIQFRNI